jgi:hypothetical protein
MILRVSVLSCEGLITSKGILSASNEYAAPIGVKKKTIAYTKEIIVFLHIPHLFLMPILKIIYLWHHVKETCVSENLP